MSEPRTSGPTAPSVQLVTRFVVRPLNLPSKSFARPGLRPHPSHTCGKAQKQLTRRRVARVDTRRPTPPDPRLPRRGLAGCRQLDPSHPALVTCDGAKVEPCHISRQDAFQNSEEADVRNRVGIIRAPPGSGRPRCWIPGSAPRGMFRISIGRSVFLSANRAFDGDDTLAGSGLHDKHGKLRLPAPRHWVIVPSSSASSRRIDIRHDDPRWLSRLTIMRGKGFP
jgi:hypothetical protein